MIWKQILESSYMAVTSEKLIPKFARGTAYFLSTCMGKIIRCHSDILGLIINRKARRIEEFGKRSKNGKIKCDCLKCRKDRVDQRRRVMSADFLASLAYNHRVCNSKRQLKNCGENVLGNYVTDYDDTASFDICKKSRSSNTEDVYFFTYSLYFILTLSLHLVAKFYLNLKSY